MKPKRIWAMMGAVYVLLSFLLITYWIATTTLIRGVTGLILFPFTAALAAQFFNRSWLLRHGRFGGHEEDPDFVEPEEGQPGAQSQLIIGVVFALLALFLLVWGVFQLIGFLGGAA
jgi:hypothetical protein